MHLLPSAAVMARPRWQVIAIAGFCAAVGIVPRTSVVLATGRPAIGAALARYADVLLGIHRGEVVTVYDNLSRRSGRHPLPGGSRRWILFEHPAVALIGD